MFLEIKQYGDFDISQTVCIFEIPDGSDINSLLREFCAKKHLTGEITKDGIQGLQDPDKVCTDFIEWMQKRYKSVKTKSISFSD